MTPEKEELRHPRCCISWHEPGVYFSVPDAYGCLQCDIWLESKCPPEEHCVFCQKRPDRPSDMTP